MNNNIWLKTLNQQSDNYIESDNDTKTESDNDTKTESDNDTKTESDNDTKTESDNETDNLLFCNCCNLIEYETEDTINFIKQLDNESLTKYVYRLNKELIDLRKEINNINLRINKFTKTS
jgi:hypothetical protein